VVAGEHALWALLSGLGDKAGCFFQLGLLGKSFFARETARDLSFVISLRLPGFFFAGLWLSFFAAIFRTVFAILFLFVFF
jgi:hypothetical protein